MDNTLSNFYNDIKGDLEVKRPDNLIAVGTPGSSFSTNPGAARWRSLASTEGDRLKDKCYRHILVDVYAKILPFDTDYIDGHKDMIHHDIDHMLKSKEMSPTEYLTSAHEKTNSPLLEFILRSGKNIRKEFIKEADETLKNAQKNGIDIPPPSVDIEDDKVDSALVDVKDDAEYKSFIDKLKQKTISKIVSDVSSIINDKKTEDDMSFKSESVKKEESSVLMLMDYMNETVLKEFRNAGRNKEDETVKKESSIQEEMIGLAIRESVLNEIDVTFKQPDSDFRSFSSKIRFNKGIVVNESTILNLDFSEEFNEASGKVFTNPKWKAPFEKIFNGIQELNKKYASYYKNKKDEKDIGSSELLNLSKSIKGSTAPVYGVNVKEDGKIIISCREGGTSKTYGSINNEEDVAKLLKEIQELNQLLK